MIGLTFGQAAMLYLGLTLGVLFTLWVIHHFKSKKSNILPPAEELLICEYCHSLYSDKTSKTVNKCPVCQSYNKLNQFKPKTRA
jgi:hypothetical protein